MPESSQELYTQNIPKAKDLMAEAGKADGFKTEIIVSSVTEYQDIAAMLKAYWLEIGIDCDLVVLDAAAFSAAAMAKEYPQMLLTGSCTANPDWSLMSIGTPGQMFNRGSWHDPVYYEAIYKGVETVDDAERAAIQKEAAQYFHDQIAQIGLPSPKYLVYWWPWMKNYFGETETMYYHASDLIARMWIDQDLKKEMGY